MKIESGKGVSGSSAGRRAGSTQAAPGFAPAVGGPERTTGATPASALTSLDAILALQGEEPPARRRARQAKRGRDGLDALEELEQGLLAGYAPASLKAEMERLQRGSELTGEAGLDAVLLEIDTRLAVEVAKLDRLLGRP